MNLLRRFRLPGLFLIVSFLTFVFYVSDLTSYGATWDELIFHREIGKNYYNFLTKGNFQPILTNPKAAWFPPVAPTVGHLFVASEKLKQIIPDDTDRFHIAAILFGSITTGVVFLITFLFTNNIYLSLFSSILLAFYPQFVTQSHNNIRDMGLTMFYSLTILTLLLSALSKRNLFWMGLSGILAGIATATKQNGAFLVAIGIIWFAFNINKIKVKRFFVGTSIFTLFFLVSFFAFWPYLWVDSFSHLLKVWDFLINPKYMTGITTFYDRLLTTRAGSIPFYYPWVMLFILTPLPMVVMVILGMISALYMFFVKDRKASLFLLWIFIPLSRFFLPKTAITFDQIRHFFEVVPLLAVFSALIVFWVQKFIRSYYLTMAVSLFAVITLLYNINISLRFRPYGTAYFNFLAGSSSYVNHAFDVEYWGNVYREAAAYLNKKYGANVKYYTAGLGAHILQHNGLKGKMTDNPEDDFDFVIFMNKQTWLRSNKYALWLLANKKPIYTIEREGKILFYQFKVHKEEYRQSQIK